MKRVLSLLLVVLTIILIAGVSVSAVNSTTPETSMSVEYFEDGSYMITTLAVYDTAPSGARATKTKSGYKDNKYYSASGDLLWTVTINGTYTYTGSKATCTKATTSSVVYDNDWKVTSATASKSGNKAIGNFTVKRYMLGIPTATKEVTNLTLTCSATGVLS